MPKLAAPSSDPILKVRHVHRAHITAAVEIWIRVRQRRQLAGRGIGAMFSGTDCAMACRLPQKTPRLVRQHFECIRDRVFRYRVCDSQYAEAPLECPTAALYPQLSTTKLLTKAQG